MAQRTQELQAVLPKLAATTFSVEGTDFPGSWGVVTPQRLMSGELL